MVSRLLALVLTCLLSVGAASAQTFTSNPFASANDIRAVRGEIANATMRLRYALTSSEHGAAEATSELVIDLATDWAAVRSSERFWLYDFRLNRVFALDPAAARFTSMNAFAAPFFRLAERQNRTGLLQMTAALGSSATVFDACDADAELGVIFPPNARSQGVEFRAQRGVQTLRCADRDIGSFQLAETPPPPSFWPMMMLEMTTHPALHRRIRESGRAPLLLTTTYRMVDAVTRRSWRLIAAESAQTAYPLETTYANGSAAVMDEILPGSGALAVEAIAGRAAGGAPTSETWNEYLADQDAAVAAILVMPSLNMFPELASACTAGSAHAVCAAARNVGSGALSDPAPRALLEIALAEQNRNSAAAIAAMQRAQASPLRDHPALGASFALALQRFDQASLAQAQAAGLPTDPAALQARAVAALPYNPAYWTDVGDRLGANYSWIEALYFYDVAFSLPMPSAVENNQALRGKRGGFEAIWRDYPDFFLPR